MPACIRGVTFPAKELIESIFASPPFSKDKTLPVGDVKYPAFGPQGHGPFRLSEETERLLRILTDRFEEQLQACGVSDSGDGKRAEIPPHWGNIVSVIEIYTPPVFASATKKKLWNFFRGARFMMQMSNTERFWMQMSDTPVKEYSFQLDQSVFGRGSPNLRLTFSVDQEKNSIEITSIYGTDLQKALDFFDPLGTGYEFFTPDQVERFGEQYPDGRWPNHIELTSPELRQYPNPPSLLSRLRGEFRENRYPDQTEAFKAYETRMRRDDQGGDGKRRRMEWAVGATGYHLN